MNWGLLERLCVIPGISGREALVRNFIIQNLPENTPYVVDSLGNLICGDMGSGSVMVCAHMDEVGGIVTGVTGDGFLRFSAVGGVDPLAFFGKKLRIGLDQVLGVVGLVPVHLLDAEKKQRVPTQDQLLIDIGACTKEEALRWVSLGDFVNFEPNFISFGENLDFISSKAIDDRIGCFLLLELLKQHSKLCAVFTAREEIGGAVSAAAFSLKPKHAIVIETTTAADLPDVTGVRRVCALGKGAVIPFMDRGTVYLSELYDRAIRISEKNGISVQTKSLIAGGNDAMGIQNSGTGVPTLTISVPCRGLHSPEIVMRKSDAEAVFSLAELVWKELRCDDSACDGL